MGRGKAWRLTLGTLCKDFLDALVSPSAEDIISSTKGQSRLGVDVRCIPCGNIFNKELYHIIDSDGSLHSENPSSLLCPRCSRSLSVMKGNATRNGKVLDEQRSPPVPQTEPPQKYIPKTKKPRWKLTKDTMGLEIQIMIKEEYS